MSKNTGGAAFPGLQDNSYDGMSMLDYFAAKALPEILADHINLVRDDIENCCKEIADKAYSVAEAMVKRSQQ